MIDIIGTNPGELRDLFKRDGIEPFRVNQVYDWIFKKFVFDFKKMTNLSKKTRDVLEAKYKFLMLEEANVQVSKKDQTTKFLFQTHDGHFIEAVLLFFPGRVSICISSQVGCPVKCAFCASGIAGVIRGLEAAEIISQVLLIARHLSGQKKKISNIVVMGVGEPFFNYENLIRALDLICLPAGFGLGARRIVVSSSGIVPKIKEFADYPKQVKLSISLHSPFNEVRDWLVPINKKYPLDELIETMKTYTRKKGKIITIEYILIRDVNDRDQDIDKLAEILKGFDIKVNLIPYNPVDLFDFKATSSQRAREFKQKLLGRDIKATIRQEKGQDIDAACGQLRLKKLMRKNS